MSDKEIASWDPLRMRARKQACVSCHTTIAAGARFCGNCGRAAPTIAFCGRCWTELTPGSRYCPSCGERKSA